MVVQQRHDKIDVVIKTGVEVLSGNRDATDNGSIDTMSFWLEVRGDYVLYVAPTACRCDRKMVD